jgi:hypothetical protein
MKILINQDMLTAGIGVNESFYQLVVLKEMLASALLHIAINRQGNIPHYRRMREEKLGGDLGGWKLKHTGENTSVNLNLRTIPLYRTVNS